MNRLLERTDFMIHIFKNGDGSYSAYEIPQMTKEERKERDRKADKQNGVIAFIVVGIIAYLVSSSFITALIAGAISYIVMRLVGAIVSR